MNKTVLSVFAGVCCLALFSCDTPKDQRPSTKVSVDMVPPGTRNTSNLESVETHGHGVRDEVMPNHDPGQNTLGGSKEHHMEGAKTNVADSVENHR